MANSVALLILNGLSYGVLLFLMACGLTVTLGLMRFANLAHAVFAMVGGYAAVTVLARTGLSFYAAVLCATLVAGALGGLFERLVCRHFYAATELRQVLLTVSVVFMSIGACTYVWGPGQQSVRVPAELTGVSRWGGVEVNGYRLLLLGVGGALTAALFAALRYTRFGAMLRAAVDNRRVATACGIDVDRLFFWTFTLGSALAGLGGALSVNLLSLDPLFGLRYLALVMFVVVVGGLGSIGGSLGAALLIGLVDVVVKYVWPDVGGYSVYAVTAACLLLRPRGLLGKA